MVLTQQKTLQAEGFSQIISYVLVLVALVEGAAWAAFGVSFWSKAVFIAWAVAMVWTRPWLVNTRILALAHGNEKLAASAATWLRVSLVITAFSLFSLYSESMETYKSQRIAESAPVLAAASRLEQAQAGLQRIKENATVDDAAILSAVATNTRLQAELETARQKAQAAFAAQQAAVQKELDAFWQSQHSNRFRYDQLLDANCNPLRTSYGVMKSAASELCPRLQAIQRKMPDIAADPEVQRIEAELAALAPALSLHSSIESAKLAVSQAEEELHGKQSASGIASSADVYPPVFHRLASLTSGNVTADNLVSVFGLLGILLLLFSLNLFQEARLLCMQDADGHIRQDAATEAQSWMSKLMFWRQDKPATLTPAPVSAQAATAQMQTPAPAGAAPTVPTVDMPPAQPRDDSGSKFGFMGTVGGVNATAGHGNTGRAEGTGRAVRTPPPEYADAPVRFDECYSCASLFEKAQHDWPLKCWELSKGNCISFTPKTVTQTKIVFRDRDRVPPELSQTGGPGRAGKIDNCIDCGSDFEVLVHNALRCPTCAAARQHKGRNIYQRTKKPEESIT